MLVYLITCTISICFGVFATHAINRQKEAISPTLESTESRIHVALIGDKNIKWSRSAKLFLLLSFLPLFIISAIRYCVGTDYAGTYQSLYFYTFRDGWTPRFAAENLYYLLNRIAQFYSGSDYTGVFALSSLLICGFTFLGYKKVSSNIGYSILLFIVSGIYFWSFNVVRQSITSAVFIFSIQYILKRQPLKYLICVLFATGFHKAGLLYLPVYFIYKVKLKTSFIIGLSLFAVLFGSFFRNIAVWMSQNISAFSIFYSRYLIDESEMSSISHIFMNITFMFLFILIRDLYGKKDDLANVWINFQLITVILSLLTPILPWASRLIRLFSTVLPLAIPYMVSLIPGSRSRLFINTGIILSFLAYTIVTFFILGYHSIIPYQTIFGR